MVEEDQEAGDLGLGPSTRPFQPPIRRANTELQLLPSALPRELSAQPRRLRRSSSAGKLQNVPSLPIVEAVSKLDHLEVEMSKTIEMPSHLLNETTLRNWRKWAICWMVVKFDIDKVG
jgi:hypothetical protein